MTDAASPTPRVGLFVTCLVDFFRPRVGFASVRLLESAGCDVEVPAGQTCCGQPAYNTGDLGDTRDIARRVIEAFAGFDYLVAPSGSCVGQIRQYPTLFDEGSGWRRRADELAGRSYEIMAFINDVLGITPPEQGFTGRVTYHDSCSGLRQLGIREQPRQLLGGNAGLEMVEMDERDTCCGFGGTFCVKYPDISTRMVDQKAESIERTGAETLLGGDLGCLMNIAGRMHRRGQPVKVRHAVEVLAGMADEPAIGEEE
ncbi:UNVERIFIED_CONTAM: (Fe-S)-binding protein [Spiribacter pallidus]